MLVSVSICIIATYHVERSIILSSPYMYWENNLMGFDLLSNSLRRRLLIRIQPLSSWRRTSSMIVVALPKSRVVTYCKGFVHIICHSNHISLLWPLIRTTLRAGDYLPGHLSSLLSLTIPGTICHSFLTCTSLHTQWCYDLPLPLVIFI